MNQSSFGECQTILLFISNWVEKTFFLSREDRILHWIFSGAHVLSEGQVCFNKKMVENVLHHPQYHKRRFIMKHRWLNALKGNRSWIKLNYLLSSERQKFYFHLKVETFTRDQNLPKPRISQTKRLWGIPSA